MKASTLLRHYNTLFGPRPFKLQKPTVVQFPVIDICNSRCQMCKIWENKKSDDITPDQLAIGLSNDLYSEVTSIGINGGEPTLRKDLPQLLEVLFEKLPKLAYISLITNAFNYKQVIEQIDKLGAIVKANSGYFDIMISLDGFEEVHDAVRGKEGNFENAKHVIQHIKSNQFVDKVRIGCTVIKENVLHLHDLLDFCIQNDLYIKYRVGIPHQRLYTKDLIDPYALTFLERYELTEFLENLSAHYETNDFQNFFYQSLIGQIMHGKKRQAGCDWQHRGATITSKGELLYCAVESPVIADRIYNVDSNELFFNGEPKLKDIIDNKCDSCLHDYTGIPPKDEARRRLKARVFQKFGVNRLTENTAIGRLGIKAYRARAFNQRINGLLKAGGKSLSSNQIDKGAINVLLVGWYGTETLGDKAILGGVLESIKKVSDNQNTNYNFYVTSLHPYLTEVTKTQMDVLVGVKILSVEDSVQLTPQMSLVAFAGGPLMGLNDLAPMEAIFNLARKSNVKTLLAGCGVGPFGDSYQKESIARILHLCDFRIYRDEKSKKNAALLGIETSEDLVAEDPAFTWLENIKGQVVTKKNKQETLLLGLRDFPYHEYSKHLSKTKSLEIGAEYERAVLSALETICSLNPKLSIVPLPMCTNHFGGDDRWFYRKIFRSNSELKNRIDYRLLGPELSPLDYCAEFASADALLGMRFHSLVFGVSFDLPSVALDYTLGKGKVMSLSDKYELPVCSLEHLAEDFIVKNVSEALAKNKTTSIDRNLEFTKTMRSALERLQFVTDSVL